MFANINPGEKHELQRSRSQIFRAKVGSVITVKLESDGDGFIGRGSVTITKTSGDMDVTLMHDDLIAGKAIRFDDGVEAVSYSLTVHFPGAESETVRVKADLTNPPTGSYCRQIAGKNNDEVTALIGAVL